VNVPMSNAIWIAVAAGIVTAVATVRVLRAKTATSRLDVGSVSNQWVAEHRVEPGHSISR
jgi:hypothetical protein